MERAGEKIVDLLHRSNPWDDSDCNRKDCVLCSTAGENEKKGGCRRRNVVYETFCVDCGLLEDEEKGEKEKRDMIMEERVTDGEKIEKKGNDRERESDI